VHLHLHLLEQAKVAMPPGNGTYCLRIHGQTYHCSNTLHPNDGDGDDRQYGQLYIIEGDLAVSTRMNSIPNSSCTNEIVVIDTMSNMYIIA